MAGTFSIPGVASGMDWGSMVDEIIAKSQKAYQPMLTKRDNLERKISLYEEFNQSIRALQTKLTTLKLSSTYKAKTTEASRLDSNGLAQAVLTATVTGDAKIMNYDIEVLQKATTMSRYGKALSGTNVGQDSTFYINVGGKRAKISVKATDKIEDIARKINSATDITSPTVKLDVVASVVDGQLVVKSTKMGAGAAKLSQVVTRSYTGADQINFHPDLKNQIINGAVVIRGSGPDCVLGLDFDIVGNEVRWRDYNPKAATAGSGYSLGYLANPADRLEYSVQRTWDIGDNIFGRHTFPTDANGTVQLPGTLDVKYGTTTYERDVDYVVQYDGIRWLGANKPPEGATYSVRYAPAAANEEWRLPAVTRGAVDKTTGAAPTYTNYMKGNGTATITQGSRTWREGLDFDIVSDGTSADKLSVKWRTEAGATVPEPGSAFNLSLGYSTTSGTVTTQQTYGETLMRSDSDDFTFSAGNPPFVGVPWGDFNDKIYGENGYVYNMMVGTEQAWQLSEIDPWEVSPYGASVTQTIKWTPPSAAAPVRTNLPPAGSNYTIEYTGNMNMFSFEDTGDGILDLLGLANYSDARDTEGKDSQVRINDGQIRTFSTNSISFTSSDTVFDDEGNVVSLLGLTINLKGVGKIQLDVTQDAEKAVTALQEYVELYNELMDWINTRSVEKQADESKKSTLASDDFRMKWGLLHGDQLLANTKNKLRFLTSFSQPLGFQTRTGREAFYGTLGEAGFRGTASPVFRLGGQKSTISITINNPDGTTDKEDAAIGGFAIAVDISENDTIQNAAEKINAAMQNYQYHVQAKLVPVYGPADSTGYTPIVGYKNRPESWQSVPMGTAVVSNGKIVLTSAFNTTGEEIPLMVQDSNGVLKVLGLSDRYTMLSQVGLSTGASTGSVGANAKSGFLEFDTDKFIEALTTDPDAVSDLLVTSMKEMDAYLTSLDSSTQTEFAPGVVGIKGRVSSAIYQLQQEIVSINKYLAAADRRLEDKATALYKSFAAAEVNLAKMSQQASWLSQVTTALAGNTSSS